MTAQSLSVPFRPDIPGRPDARDSARLVALRPEALAILVEVAGAQRGLDETWGRPDSDDRHQAEFYHRLIQTRVEHGKDGLHDPDRQRAIMLEIAALAVSAVASIDANGHKWQG